MACREQSFRQAQGEECSFAQHAAGPLAGVSGDPDAFVLEDGGGPRVTGASVARPVQNRLPFRRRGHSGADEIARIDEPLAHGRT